MDLPAGNRYAYGMSQGIGARIAAARKERGLSQGQLAHKSGIAQAHVSHFECGTRAPRIDNLLKLADALGVTTDFLLGRQTAAAKADE